MYRCDMTRKKREIDVGKLPGCRLAPSRNLNLVILNRLSYQATPDAVVDRALVMRHNFLVIESLVTLV